MDQMDPKSGTTVRNIIGMGAKHTMGMYPRSTPPPFPDAFLI
jgi:hypothetical protein